MEVDKDSHGKEKTQWGRRGAAEGRVQAVSTARDQQRPEPGRRGQGRWAGRSQVSGALSSGHWCKAGETGQAVTPLTSENTLAHHASVLRVRWSNS